MTIENVTTYNQILDLEADLNKGLNALLVLQNYYDIKNLPIADLEQLEDELFKKRTQFDKKRLSNL